VVFGLLRVVGSMLVQQLPPGLPLHLSVRHVLPIWIVGFLCCLPDKRYCLGYVE